MFNFQDIDQDNHDQHSFLKHDVDH